MNERDYLDNVLTELENNLTNEEENTMTETIKPVTLETPNETPSTRTYEIVSFLSRSVVAYEVDGKLTKYVVCSDYDASKPVGDQWVSGHYYELWSYGNDASMTLRRAMFDLYCIPYSSDMTPSRMRELMTLFKDALVSEDRDKYDVSTSEGYDSFKSDFELDDDEMSYLGIDKPQLYEVVEVEVSVTRTYKVNVAMPYGGTNQYELLDVISDIDLDFDDYDDEDTNISDWNIEDEALTAEEVRNNWGYDVANIDDLDD